MLTRVRVARAMVKFCYFLIKTRDCDMRCEGTEVNHI